MSGIIPAIPGLNPTPVPINVVAAPQVTGDYISTFTIDVTAFFLLSAIIIVMVTLIFLYLFGQPIIIASKSSQSGRSIIQHFDTPKSATIKDAFITGDAFQYGTVQDGTVSATPHSVNSLYGRQIALTFATLGVTLPIDLVAGMSILSQKGITDHIQLQNYRKEYIANQNSEPIIVSGYNFFDFKELLKQHNEEKLIPLMVEAAPKFTDKNINACFTEAKLKIVSMMDVPFFPGAGQTGQLIGIALVILIMVAASTVIK